MKKVNLETKQLIYVGHFDIGECYSKKTEKLINQAKTMEGDIIVLVGNIGVENKIITYINQGIEGLRTLYEERLNSCTSICQLHQLPKNTEEIHKIIDLEFYEETTLFLKKEHLKIYNSIKNNSHYKEDLTSILNKVIVPQTIQKRIDSYGFTMDRKIIIEKEKYLRNRVKNKTKNDAPWTEIGSFEENGKGTFIGSTQIISTQKVAICRGIMFSLYEKIWLTKYTKIIHFLEKKHERSTKKGFEFFEKYYRELDYLKRESKDVVFFVE